MPSPSVDNEGSVARDHLANERTYLAWFRTALGLVGLGVLLEKLEIAEGRGLVAGLFLIGFGGLTMLYGVSRYLHVTRELSQGKFPVDKRGPILLSAGAIGLVFAAGIYLLS